ncbi:MAG: helix-turn-helix transcriptional regulator [Coxiellaceae bacterium]|nr:helix-turn-helix transcriptional regulator [Coxiellaceae bacterium]
MTTLKSLKKKWMKDPKVKAEYQAHAIEFTIARKLVTERLKAKLTQKDIAERMGTTQSVIARLESGAQLPTIKTIERYALALGKYPEIRFREA